MTTWQLWSDAGEGFRWEKCEEAIVAPKASQRQCLPSMADILVQGSPVRVNRAPAVGIEIQGGNSIGTPMFRTGSGKSVGLNQSSIARASAILGNHGGKKAPYNNKAGIYGESLFQTASGKMVCLSSEGLERAKSLLGTEEDDNADQLRLRSTEPSTPIKFQTAGGRSISISADALKRARTLLEVQDLVIEGNAADQVFSLFNHPSSGKENTPLSSQSKPPSPSKNFTSPLRSYSSQLQVPARRHNIGKGHNLINKFDAEATNMKSFDSRSKSSEKPPRIPLADISNGASVGFKTTPWSSGEKRRIGLSTVSPFKRPRTSKFVTPLTKTCSAITTKETASKGRVSTRYPFKTARLNIQEYMGGPPLFISKGENLPDHIKKMNPDVAEKYTFRDDAFGSGCVGAEIFYHMLIQSGASHQYVSKEWVTNHYKWIVWKLASYERSYPAKFCGKMLSVSNVLEELKYRYEKEVNHGHRSSVKRILEGDSPPSTRIVLCISSILPKSEPDVVSQSTASKESESGVMMKIELTDGWYSINALLDDLLSRKLAAGKLFVGQKLTISGAGLCGWAGPVSPLEASNTASLLLHMNGTYRANWADRLGFGKGAALPLAFRSIKCDGGVVPSTLIGILRIYPLLFRERLSDGNGIVRSERMQAKLSQLLDQRRSVVIEGVMSEFQRGNGGFDIVDNCCEGAKLLMMLETAAEPELLMAEMTSEQLTSLSSYQAKIEATRQNKMKIHAESALEAAGLSGEDFTPFMRVRVIGLTSKCFPNKGNQQTGLITIWNPTEKQQLELVEGRVYAVSWLMPSTSDSSALHLQTKGSNTKWSSLSPAATESFLPFFSPRRSILLRNMGEVSFASEFDVAAYVVYVGDVYYTAHRKKQWIFVADGSLHDESLLAINFCVPSSESDPFEPVNSNLAGSTVGFCNLIKREKDVVNNVWIAEATESCTYSLTYDQAYFSHLKGAAASTQKWANISSLKIQNLGRKVSSIISNSMKNL